MKRDEVTSRPGARPVRAVASRRQSARIVPLAERVLVQVEARAAAACGNVRAVASTGFRDPVRPLAVAALVERGGAVGLHLIVLADGAGPLEATLGRNGLRNFHHRVLFQMSSNDSAALTDTTEAAGLGSLRGLLFREDRGTAVPFRPYRAPA